MIEEVKKILLQPTVQTGKPIMNEFAAGQLARQICQLFEPKCFHCGKVNNVLINLHSAEPEAHKIICLNCFVSRHPQTCLDTLEFLLDKEAKRVTYDRRKK